MRSLVLVLLLLAGAADATSDLFVVGSPRRLAGGGLGDGSPATAVSLLPTGVLPTGDGGLWIADELFNRIRRVAVDGTIHTVVGSGRYGLSEDGLPALESHLGIPADLSVGPDGNLYFVDLASHRVRFVDAAGRLHTFVGPEAPLFAGGRNAFVPASLAFGPRGRLHVADRGTNTVWQFDADGSGRRAAGNGERGHSGDGGPSALGRLDDPQAVAVGPEGAIWIADTGNRRLRVVDPDGRLHTVAGDGDTDAPLAGTVAEALRVSLKPRDVAVTPDGQVVILDALGPQLLRLGRAPRFVDGVLQDAATLALVHRFGTDSEPVAIQAGADGRLYVADRQRRQVLVLDLGVDASAPPVLQVVAGNGTPRVSGDGLAAVEASLYPPTAIAFGPRGELLVADRGIESLRAALNHPAGVTFGADGRVHVADQGSHRILRLDDGGLTTIAGGPDATVPLRQPSGLAFDGAGRLLIADAGNGLVRRVDTDGTVTDVAGNGREIPVDDGGPALQAALIRPVDVKVDALGVLWIADAGAHRVYRLGPDGLLRLVAGSNAAGAGQTGSLARHAALDQPMGVEPDDAGGVFIADAGNGRLLHVGSDGVLRVLADDVGTPARLTTAPDGALVFSDIGTHRVLRLDLERSVTPPSMRVTLGDADLSMATRAALPLAGLQQVLVDAPTGAVYVTHRGGLDEVSGSGVHDQVFVADMPRFRAQPLQVDGFGDGFLVATAPDIAPPQPLALVRTGPSGALSFALEFHLDGADAVAADDGGDLFLHQPDGDDGRILRIVHERLANIPGFAGAVGGVGVGATGASVYADLRGAAAAITPAPDGGLYVALRSRELLWAHDADGDGRADASEQRRLGIAPEAVVALTVAGDVLYVGTTGQRIYRLHGGSLELVAAGFAPRLLDVATAPGGGLLVLEGDGRSGRLLEIRAARPEIAAWPAVLDFEPTPFGQRAVATVVLRNDGTRTVRVVPRVAAASAVSVGDAAELAPGEIQPVEVSWTPEAPGAHGDEILWLGEAGVVLARTTVVLQALAPRLEATDLVDLGTAWVGGVARVELPLANRGDLPLAIEAVELRTDAGTARGGNEAATLGWAVALDAVSVPAGGSTSMSVVLTPVARRAHLATLRLHTDDPVQPVHEIDLRGLGGRAELDVTAIDLGAVLLGSRQTQRLAVTNIGELGLRVERMDAALRGLSITPSRLEIPAGETRTVRVDFSPADYGPVDGELVLHTDDPVHPRWRIPYSGRGVSRLVEPSAYAHDFGSIGAGEAATWELQLHNHQPRRLRLPRALVEGRAFRIVQRPDEVAPGSTGVVTVEYRGGGPSKGRLVLETDLEEAPRIIVELSGRVRVAGRVELRAPETIALWPGEPLELPVHLEFARDLRGVSLTVAEPDGFTLLDVTIPASGLLSPDQALAIAGAEDGGLRQVGVSLTGAAAGAGVSGSGTLVVLRFQPRGAPTSVHDFALQAVVGRGADGARDTLVAPAPAVVRVRLKGDLNEDGRLDLVDFFSLVDALSTGAGGLDRLDLNRYDLDGDGALGIADVRTLIAHLPAAGADKAAAALDRIALPAAVGLRPPHPNPFNAATTLVIELPVPGAAELLVYNVVGQRVARVLRGWRGAGVHRVVWDGRADDGTTLRSGTYFAVLRASGEQRVRRLLLVR